MLKLIQMIITLLMISLMKQAEKANMEKRKEKDLKVINIKKTKNIQLCTKLNLEEKKTSNITRKRKIRDQER